MDGGRRVWAPHALHGFVLGTIIDLGTDTLTVKPTQGGEPITATYDRVFPAIEESVKAVEDNCGLMYLNEATLLRNVRARYEKDLIYTYAANILLAVNPYHEINQLYSSSQVQRYKGQSLGVLPPHIFAIADKAYRDMRLLKQSQSIVVSGESGAGKTESTKYIIRYLTDAWGTGAGSIEQRLNEANPLLEAFGNARTMRNHNSSRFGKFVEVHYDEEAKVVGGFVSHYLLEKSRVCKQTPEERNYHIFYRLIAGASTDTKHALGLTDLKDYTYLNGGSLKDISNDEAEFAIVENAMSKLGIDATERMNLYRVVAAVLHLGNITFEDSGDSKGGSVVAAKSRTALRGVSGLLGLQPDDLQDSLTSRVMTTTKSGAKGTVYKIPLKRSEAVSACDALAKAMYVRLFSHIVMRVNDGFAFDKSSYYIGVLDIAGFEYYQVNSYEQFCINYCNEKLQQFFNDRVLKQEQELYEEEGLNVEVVSFIDNRDCIELIEAKSTGIIDLLDEESKLPQSSDMHFCENVHAKHKGHFRLAVPRQSKLASHRNIRDGEGFLIRHFAGAVCYQTKGFIDKNNDALHESLEMLMLESQDAFVNSLFKQQSGWTSPTGSRKSQGSSRKLALDSIASKFRSQLVVLLEKLRTTGASFVRCLKPNLKNAPHQFMGAEILSQLHCAGMVAVLNLMDDGYPSRTSYEKLHKMYQKHMSSKVDAHSFCDALFRSIGMHESDYKFGKTKVFFRPGKFAEIDHILQSDQKSVVALAGKTSKWLVRARWRQAQYAVLACIKLMRKIHYRGKHRVVIQNNVRGYLAKKQYRRRFEALHKLHTLKTRLDAVTVSVRQLKGNQKTTTDKMAELSKAIDKECAKIKSTALSPAIMAASYSDLSGQLEQLLTRVQEMEHKQKADESAIALQLMREEIEREKRARKEEEERVKREMAERRMKAEMEAKRRQEEERQKKLQAERQLKEQEEAAKKLQAQIDSEEQTTRMAVIEQERRDRELALRLAQEDGATQEFDPQSPQDEPDSRLSRRSLRRSLIVTAKQQEKAAHKYDLSVWKYAELRDTINTSCDVELLEACREEFHRRLKVYQEWKLRNKRKTPSGQQETEQQRLPDSVIEAARTTFSSSGSTASSTALDTGEVPQRYFRVPFVRPAGQPRDQPKGWWYAHFDGQWIARQIDMLPGKKPLLLVAGKDDMEMCELSLEQTGLTSKKGAEILPRQFDDLWARHSGPPYERPTDRKK